MVTYSEGCRLHKLMVFQNSDQENTCRLQQEERSRQCRISRKENSLRLYTTSNVKADKIRDITRHLARLRRAKIHKKFW